MGLFIDHTVTLSFETDDQADRFTGYVKRIIKTKREEGADVDRLSEVDWKDRQWTVLDDYPQTVSALDVELGETRGEPCVTLYTSGYGMVPTWIILSAIEQYQARALYGKTYPCQGQEDERYLVRWERERGYTDTFLIPDWYEEI